MFSVLIAWLYLLLLLFKKASASVYRKSFPCPDKSVPLNQVGILQPILSGDPNLFTTLESNLLALDGACFYWLVDDEDPLAHSVVDSLIQRHQDKSIVKLSYPEVPEGINPKLFKLNQALPLCQESCCIVLDDDTTLPEPSLQVMLAELKRYALVTGLPQYQEQGCFYSLLLAAFVNNNASFTYLSLLPYMEPITINGMCYAFKREQFQSIGGFQAVLACLTDDLAMAELVLSHGGKIRQTPFIQLVATSVSDAKHYIQQMHRWHVFANILFFKQKIKVQLLILVLHALPPLLMLSLWLFLFLDFSIYSSISLILTLVVRQFLIAKHFNLPRGALSVLSESLQSFHLVHAFCSRKIRWRSRYYRVKSNSQFTSL